MEICFGIIPIIKEENGFKVVLVKHLKGNYWGFPKGHSNKEEDPKKAAERELEEETNLKVKKYILDECFLENYFFLRDQKKIEKTVYYFLAEVEGEVLFQKEEIIDVSFFFLDDAICKLTYDQSRKILIDLKKEVL